MSYPRQDQDPWHDDPRHGGSRHDDSGYDDSRFEDLRGAGGRRDDVPWSPSAPGVTQPGVTRPGSPQSGRVPPGYPQSAYPQSEPRQQPYSQPAYPQQTYPERGRAQPDYPDPGYSQGGYPQPARPQSGYAESDYGPADYSQPGHYQPGGSRRDYPHQGGPRADYAPQAYAQPGPSRPGYAQPGYPQPGHPQQQSRLGYDQPAYGQPYPPQSTFPRQRDPQIGQPYEPEPEEPTGARNGLAITALVLGICGGWGLLTIGFAVAGIRRAAVVGRGRTMSIVAIVLAVLWIPGYVVLAGGSGNAGTSSTASSPISKAQSLSDVGCQKAEVYATQMAATIKNDPTGTAPKLGTMYTAFAAELTKDAALTKNATASDAMKKAAADFRELGSDVTNHKTPTSALSARIGPDSNAVDAACGLK